MNKIETRDLEIFLNLQSRFKEMPESAEVHRKFRECLNAGLFDIPGSRIGFAGNPDVTRLWFLACTAELNRFFITLEQKYGFNGNEYTVNNSGEIVPVKSKQNLPPFDITKFQPQRGVRF